ncbi:MAG TPA: phosphoribosylaminoimidazolesuccinocarboxamide synthase [Myxococcaceae bacterium]|nr:phosphoribosylaminoimidazolesuccinocarboxamide synthase [Myxococcaceae bacterium]
MGAFETQLQHTLRETDFPGLGDKYRGKVRDVYGRGDRLALIATDRLSAFDHILTTVPFKGELLTRTAVFWFEKTKDVVPNHLLDAPDPNVCVVRRCERVNVEVVVRGYLTGSLWRDVQEGKAGVYGVPIPAGMKKDAAFEKPILTPSTKEEVGKHDEPISAAALVARGLCTQRDWERISEAALAVFAEGQKWAASRGLILVDTKYEFGKVGDALYLIDEIHTQDCSRYWDAGEYAARFAGGQDQKMLDKENIRQWLIKERGFSGHGTPPAIPDEVRVDLARTYASTYERLTGQPFRAEPGDVADRIRRNLTKAGLFGS